MNHGMNGTGRRRTPHRRRARAALAAALAAALGLQGGWQDAGAGAQPGGPTAAAPGNGDGPDRRTDASVRLREAVEREAARLRESLDAAEQAEDFAGLVRRKLTVDAALAPLHLVRDAVEFTAGSDDCDLLRSLRAEWRPDGPSSRWSHVGAADRARRSLAAALRMDRDGRVRIRARMALLAWNGAEAPPAVDWEIEGVAAESGPVVTARCVRVLPAFDAEHVGFPLPSTGFVIRWDSGGAAYDDGHGTTHGERWSRDACFDNPADMYAAFDGLRLERSGDRRCRALATAADEVPSMPIASVRSLERPDGTELRRERWNWEGGALRSIAWSQPELSVLHRSPQAAMIVAEAGGEVVSRTEHRARSPVRMPPIDAELRWDGPSTASFTMQVDGEAWAVGTIEALGADRRIDGAGQPALEALEVDGLVRHAMHQGDAERLQRAVDTVEAFHASVDSPPAQRSAERELLARRLLAGGHPEIARALLVGRWLRDLRAGEAEAAVDRWCAAGEPTLARAIGEASGASTADDREGAASGPCAAPASPDAGAALACEVDRLEPGCARFARSVIGAVEAASPAWMDAGRLRSALCAACERGALPALGDDALRQLAQDARIAAGAGVGGDHDDAAKAAERFVEAAVEAAGRPRCTDAVLDAMRRSWRSIALEAVAALRSFDASEAVDELRRRLQSTEALLGNRFVPALDAGEPADPPPPGVLRAALAARIGAVVEAERRRTRTADAILDRTLAEARNRATPGRIANAAGAAAIDEYVRWAIGARPPGA